MDFDDLDDAVGGRPFDIIVYGATGYTGCLICEHLDAVLAQPRAEPKRWAIAGRNKKKLEIMASHCKTEPGTIEVADKEGILYMAEMCSVIITAAGPYMLCGTDVVAACLEKKTNYIDVTGELVWMKRMINRYHAKAREAGVMIVQCSGMMSAPNDLNCYLLAKTMGPLAEFREYQMEVGVGTGGGTFFSGYAGYDLMYDNELDVLLNPFSLGGERSCGRRPEDEDPREACEDPLFPKVWVSGGHGTPCSGRLLRRSCGLFEEPVEGADDGEAPPKYGDGLVVVNRNCFLREGLAKQRAHTTREPREIRELMKHAKTMEDAVKRGQFAPPGGGPTRAARVEGLMEVFAVCKNEAGAHGHIHFRGPDPYEITAMTTVTGALVMLEEADKIRMKDRGGVLTPAYAFHGSTYIERLQATPFACIPGRSMSFEVRDGLPPPEVMEACIQANDDKTKSIVDRSLRGEIEGSWAPPDLLTGT